METKFLPVAGFKQKELEEYVDMIDVGIFEKLVFKALGSNLIKEIVRRSESGHKPSNKHALQVPARCCAFMGHA
jgi:hypothetical protein